MKKQLFFFILMALMVICTKNTDVFAEDLTFAIIAKSKTDRNFIAVYEAAKAEASKFNDTILFAGSEEIAHFRTQDKAVREVLNKKIDGLAISVLNEDFLAANSFREVSERNIPVVTYDSDFSEKYRHFKNGYIGTDNESFGYRLGLAARKLRPQGGTIAIMSGGPDDSNLNLRILGVRRALSGNGNNGQRLTGEGGWAEHIRTPWYNWDDYNQALVQMLASLRDKNVDVLLSVGWHPQMAEDYREKVSPYKAEYLDTKEKIILCADGTPIQLEYFREGLSHVNVAQNFEEMGRLCYKYLKLLTEGQKIPEYTYTPVKVFIKED